MTKQGDETKTEPDTVVHLYVQSDTFNVCLIVTNAEGCTDTVCHAVQAIIHPLLDVPNAFTPGRFGQNAVIKVEGGPDRLGLVFLDLASPGVTLTARHDCSFYCKRHGSTFDPGGHVTKGPANRDLPLLATSVNGAGHLLVTVSG